MAAPIPYSVLHNPAADHSREHRLCFIPSIPSHRTFNTTVLCSHLRRNRSNSNLSYSLSSSDGGFSDGIKSGGPRGRGGGFGGWHSDGIPGDHHHNEKRSGGPLGILLEGWRARVSADPQFPLRVFMEEVVGVTACILGDMASHPNCGLNELDFVFSTLLVGSILNFVLMYLLAPTSASAAASAALPSIFASCPTGHMFEPSPYSFFFRLSTLAAVGFAAGLVGIVISNID